MAAAIESLTITINGATYTGEVATGATSITVPYAAKGATISAYAASVKDGTTVIENTATVASAVVVPASAVTVTVKTVGDTPSTIGTVSLTVTMAEGAGNVTGLTYPGWFKFKRMPMNLKYTTNGVTLKGVDEVLAVQAAKIVSFEFDPATKKLVLYTATNTQASNNTVYEVVILALGD